MNWFKMPNCAKLPLLIPNGRIMFMLGENMSFCKTLVIVSLISFGFSGISYADEQGLAKEPATPEVSQTSEPTVTQQQTTQPQQRSQQPVEEVKAPEQQSVQNPVQKNQPAQNQPTQDQAAKQTEATEPQKQASDQASSTKVAENADVKVVDFVLASKIEAREPKDIVEGYTSEQDKAYAFARLNVKKHSQLTFVWLLDGKERNRFTTQVHAAKSWRTYASTKIRPGKWKVQLLLGNEVLAERAFTVQ